MFVIVVAATWLPASLLEYNLPANRTSSFAAALILTAVVLKIGGPLIGIFLTASFLHRAAKDPARPPPPRLSRRQLAGNLVVVGICVGFGLLALGLVTLVPAAWLAGGGDRPPGPNTPTDPMILYIVIGIGVAGIVLLTVSLIGGLVLRVTGERNATRRRFTGE